MEKLCKGARTLKKNNAGLLYRKFQFRDMLYCVPIFLLVFACATIFNGTSQEINISSSPSAATVYVNGQDIGQTPIVQSLKRKTDVTIKIELDGYNPFEIKLTKKISGWFWADIFLTGLIGVVVDAATGAMYNFEPSIVTTNLTKFDDTIFIYTDFNINSENLLKIGQLTKK